MNFIWSQFREAQAFACGGGDIIMYLYMPHAKYTGDTMVYSSIHRCILCHIWGTLHH